MKRALKLQRETPLATTAFCLKVRPNEEGTETSVHFVSLITPSQCLKVRPNEEGTETGVLFSLPLKEHESQSPAQ